jgi:putative membrane-bound dehydrogenase-like protein
MIRIFLILLLAAPAVAQREFGFDNTKSSGQPYLSPEESVKRMKVADGFEVKLFAAEPQIINPIAMTVDEKGRVWVVESFEYPKRTPKGKIPRDRIKILESTKGDGVCDKVTTFIEGKDFPVPFDMASGIEVGNGGVYLGAAPYLFFIENKNDKPGKIEILLKGFGSQDTHETLNTFQWGPDGRLYGLHGVFTYSKVTAGTPPANAGGSPPVEINAGVWRYDTKTKKFEVFAEGTSNPWGMDWRNTDGQFILCCCVIPHLFHMVPGGNYKRQGGLPSNPYAYGEIKEICDHTFHKESGWAHAGLISLDTPIMPEKYRNSVIFGSIHGCSIKQNILKPNGSSFTASRGDDFLVSGDKNFRPVNLRWGHNGEIYCIDWHDQHPCHQTNPDDWDYEHGRVYRIQRKGLKTTVADDLSKKKSVELYEKLDDSNPYIARTALRLLQHERLGDARESKDWRFITNPVIGPCLFSTAGFPANRDTYSRAPRRRELDMRFGIEAWLARIDKKEWSADELAKHLKGIVLTNLERREIASAIARYPANRGLSLAIRHLLEFKEDSADPNIPQLLWVAYEPGLAAKPKEELAWLKDNAAGNALITDTIVPRAMRRLIATGKREDVGLCVAFIGDVTDSGVRAKALDALVSAIGNRTVDAPHEWDDVHPKLEKDTNADVKRLTNSLAVKFRDSAAIHRAMAVAGDSTKQTPERLAALRDLVVVRSPSTAPFLLELVRGKDDAELKAEAIRALGNIDMPKISADLLAEWEKLSPPLRNEVVQVLAGRRDWANDLLAAVGSKKVDRTALNDNTVMRIQALNDKRLNDQIGKVWGRMRATPAELNQLIDKMRGELAKAPGSFERGKLVFDNQCAKCHKFEGRGHEVGPNIEGAGRDIEYLLVNVLDPNRVIGAPYFMRTVTLLNMRTEVGILAAEDGTSITLKTENGVLKQIQKKDIDDIKVQEKSLMPEGLDKNMSIDNFRDLVRYAMLNPFVINVEINKANPVVGVSGRIPLPEGQVTLTAKVIAPADMTARLLVGCKTDFEVNGVKGKGGGGDVRPDQSAIEVKLQKGENTLTFTTKAGKADALYLRFHDPERKLRYPEPSATK